MLWVYLGIKKNHGKESGVVAPIQNMHHIHANETCEPFFLSRNDIAPVELSFCTVYNIERFIFSIHFSSFPRTYVTALGYTQRPI